MGNRCMRPARRNGRASSQAFRSPWSNSKSRVSQRLAHQQSRTEAGFERADDDETARKIELLGVKISHYVQRARARRARHLGAVFDQLSPDSLTLNGGLDKQRVEFGFTIIALQKCGEADDGAVLFQDEDAARGDLFQRHVDGIRMTQQGIAIAFIAERGAPLQRLERPAFSGNGAADNHAADYTRSPEAKSRVRFGRSEYLGWATDI